MVGNLQFIDKGSNVFFLNTINATSAWCPHNKVLCLIGTLELYFNFLGPNTKLLDLTIDGYGERNVKILI